MLPEVGGSEDTCCITKTFCINVYYPTISERPVTLISFTFYNSLPFCRIHILKITELWNRLLVSHLNLPINIFKDLVYI